MLAKAFGQFYASQMLRFTSKTSKKRLKAEVNNKKTVVRSVSPISLTFELRLSFEQIEAALESYTHEEASDKKAKRNRTYLMTVNNITMQQRSKSPKQFSRLTVRDISLIQLCEVKQDGRRVLKPGTEIAYEIVGKKDTVYCRNVESPKSSHVNPPVTPSKKSNHHPLRTPKELRLKSPCQQSTAESSCEFIRVCHYRDGENHVDEVEFDIIDVIVRVTPVSLIFQ